MQVLMNLVDNMGSTWSAKHMGHFQSESATPMQLNLCFYINYTLVLLFTLLCAVTTTQQNSAQPHKKTPLGAWV